MIRKMKTFKNGVSLLLAAWLPNMGMASSHMDAPLITLDPAANTTDVYAFVQENGGQKYLVVALGVYPFEEPGIGPNKYNFDDNVLYELHLALGGKSIAAGEEDLSYQFKFETSYKNKGTILQSYLGVIQDVGDTNQNLTQTYTVTKVDHRPAKGHPRGKTTVLGQGTVPPNNQGIATPFYNQGNNGENPAKDGVATAAELDRYTAQAVVNLPGGYRAFAGQRDDGFYADIQAIFDLLQLRNPGKDAQGGFNLHLMALQIPIGELGGDMQVAGVYATTSRRQVRILRDGDHGQTSRCAGDWVQVARQGNPLFKLINLIVFGGAGPAPETNRTDIAGIFIPDLIKVDLSTSSCRLAGNGTNSGANPDDPGFSRLGIFGGDVLHSAVQVGFGGGTIPGGWPNGRRFGDDVVDIAVTALISDLRVDPPIIRGPAGDNVDGNDMAYNKVFPYESTPHNGRNHSH